MKLLFLLILSLKSAPESEQIHPVAPDTVLLAQYMQEIDNSLDSVLQATQEFVFQQDVDAIFDDELLFGEDETFDIDTSFAWNNNRINAGRFDYSKMEDTVYIPLVDSARGIYFSPPPATRVTSDFGQRRYLWHYGIDIKVQTGDTICSLMDGIVRVIQMDRRGYGRVVVVRHHNGLETIYGHLSKVSVEANQTVRAGEIVGLGGNTGRSTGSHLHLETRYHGEPFNPRVMIDFETFSLRSDTLKLSRSDFEYLTELRRAVYYTIRKGDNLGSIARKYGTSVKSLCKLNRITPKTILSIGRRIMVRSGKVADSEVTLKKTPPEQS